MSWSIKLLILVAWASYHVQLRVVHMRRECRERFTCHRLHRKPLFSDPGMHHDTCVSHAPWSMSGSLTRDGGENVPGIPGACTTRNFTYLARSPWWLYQMETFSGLPGYWPIVQGSHRSRVNSPHKGQWRGAWIFSWQMQIYSHVTAGKGLRNIKTINLNTV